MNTKFVALIAGLALFGCIFLFGCTAALPTCGNELCEIGETGGTCPSDCNINDNNISTDIQQVPLCVGPNGNDNYTQGSVVGVCADCKTKNLVGGNSDTCIIQSSDGTRQITTNSETLMKFYCTSEGWKRKIVDCNCENGACIN